MNLFLQDLRDVFRMMLNIYGIDVVKEISFWKKGSEEDQLKNEDRQYTKAFRHPHNGFLSVTLTSATFSDFIRNWIGIVRDCYILCTDNLDNPLHPCSRELS